jgi:hypothetical protein
VVVGDLHIGTYWDHAMGMFFNRGIISRPSSNLKIRFFLLGYYWDIVIKINTIPNITGKYYPNITKRIGFIIFSTWDSIGLIIILYYWTYPPVSSNVAIAWKPPMKMEVSMENHLHRGFLIAIFDYRRV